ncbi:MAG: hypothetical protein H6644_12890 [Caldilineaceae bacterium]|nr:hypothetical protein [Caldilineaceae bacterium]
MSILQAVPTSTRRWKLAYWTSQILSPPVVGIVAIGLCALAAHTHTGWLWALAYTLFAVIVPSAYVVYQVKRGTISDFHMERREERIRPLILTLACAIAAWWVLWLWDSPRPLRLFAAANWLQTLLFLLLTTRWKVSMHTAAISGFSVLAAAFMGAGLVTLSASVCVPVVAWSRVHMRRHTLGQTLGGIVLGVGTVTAMLMAGLY